MDWPEGDFDWSDGEKADSFSSPDADYDIEPNSIVHGDCVDVLESFERGAIDLVITSPPYNVGKDYGDNVDDSMGLQNWKEMIENLAGVLYEKVVPDGKVVFEVEKSYKSSDRFHMQPLPAYIINIMENVGFDLFTEIIWRKDSYSGTASHTLGSFRTPTNIQVRQIHEKILVFNKTDNTRKPDNPKLVEESKLTKEEWSEYARSIWRIDPVRHSKFDVDHSAVFPIEIPRRLIKMFSFKNDLVVDPFMGTGTTAVAAKELDRQYFGVDLNEEYVDFARNRVEE